MRGYAPLALRLKALGFFLSEGRISFTPAAIAFSHPFALGSRTFGRLCCRRLHARGLVHGSFHRPRPGSPCQTLDVIASSKPSLSSQGGKTAPLTTSSLHSRCTRYGREATGRDG
jgi:hypothetical protein